ncbi:MAG: hypothetical protein ACLFT6_07945 [Bacteroidales bacterium]
MKLIAKFDNGEQKELTKIKGLDSNCDVVFMKLNMPMRPRDIEKAEEELTQKVGKKVVLLQPFIDEVISL